MIDEPTTDTAEEAPETAAEFADEAVSDVLVEEVSIDGMCGVY